MSQFEMCGTCKFHLSCGECHRFPPYTKWEWNDNHGQYLSETIWPLTCDDDSCGEWRQGEVKGD